MEKVSKVVCEVSCWRLLVGDTPRSGCLTEVDRDQIETLIKSNQHYTTGEIADIFKIPKLSVKNYWHQLGYVHHFDVWFPHKQEKPFLTIFLHAILYLNITKLFHFKKQIVTGNRKWIPFNNVEWKRLWGKRNEPPSTTTRPVFIQRRWYCLYGGIGREFSYELLLENQMINSNKYCSHLNQLEAALDKKHPELVNRECIIFHQDNTRSCVHLMTRQKLLQLDWEVLIHLLHSPAVVLLMPIDFSLYRILLMEKISIPWKTVNHLEQFFA